MDVKEVNEIMRRIRKKYSPDELSPEILSYIIKILLEYSLKSRG